MPSNVVKTKSDEAKWERAKAQVRKEYPGKENSDSDSFYALTNHIYQNMKKGSAMDHMRKMACLQRHGIIKFGMDAKQLALLLGASGLGIGGLVALNKLTPQMPPSTNPDGSTRWELLNQLGRQGDIPPQDLGHFDKGERFWKDLG